MNTTLLAVKCHSMLRIICWQRNRLLFFILANGNGRLVSLFLFFSLKLNNLYQTETALFHYHNHFENGYIVFNGENTEINYLFRWINQRSQHSNKCRFLPFENRPKFIIWIGQQNLLKFANGHFLDYWTIWLILNLMIYTAMAYVQPTVTVYHKL